ncbi:hypothetical protein Pcinc_019945 [Petrolisthes cinctipes]|uniref:Uncharacterized protein n=1 Tax=Petrolisthes cinctipes TaxID=88211 RepID=A0AAE1FK12_PETCI|nr:hypothetical protein Pcinc_019945 [Petrolisthes cinctipes]
MEICNRASHIALHKPLLLLLQSYNSFLLPSLPPSPLPPSSQSTTTPIPTSLPLPPYSFLPPSLPIYPLPLTQQPPPIPTYLPLNNHPIPSSLPPSQTTITPSPPLHVTFLTPYLHVIPSIPPHSSYFHHSPSPFSSSSLGFSVYEKFIEVGVFSLYSIYSTQFFL